jgi:heterodisulfide reductase subunit A-like polyferredoxin
LGCRHSIHTDTLETENEALQEVYATIEACKWILKQNTLNALKNNMKNNLKEPKETNKELENSILVLPSSLNEKKRELIITGAGAAGMMAAASAAKNGVSVLILEKMEKAKEDMLRIQKRLDVIIAVTSEDLENRKEGFSDSLAQKKEDFTASITTRVEDLKSNIEGKLESFRTSAQKSPNQYLESMKNEVAELRQKYTRSVADRENVSSLRDFFQRDMIRSNPTMSSEKFKEALEELKQHSNKKNK